ncbi:MAG: S8 family peptidase [Muribaculaceae bacterium]|nr:S8 family peptidase [Muribaculaceae bacterium]
MKKLYPALLMAGLALGASAQNKFDAQSVMLLQTYKDMQVYPTAVHVMPVDAPFDLKNIVSRADSKVSVLVRLADGVSASSFENEGFEVITDLGDMAILSGTMDDIAALQDNPAVLSASFGGKVKPMLERSREVTGMDVVQAGGDGLPQAYTGKGIIAGIFDTGMDPNHANFLDADKNPRVKVIYHYPNNNGTAITYSTPERVKNFTTDNANETHGTHTTGCMAGSYNGRGGKVATFRPNGTVLSSATTRNPYYGMATESEIAMGCGPLYLNNVIAGVEKLITYAKNAGKPVAINLSIGSNAGPHDGTDDYTAAINRLGNEAIICIAAGNEGDTKLSIDRTFTASDNSYKSILWDGAYNYSGTADFWSDNSTAFDFDVQVLDRKTGEVKYTYNVPAGKEVAATLTTSNYTNPGYIRVPAFDEAFSNSYLNVTSSANKKQNNRYSVTINGQINYNQTKNSSRNLVLAIVVKGSAGQRVVATSDLADFYSLDVPGYIDGNAAMSVNNLACGKNTICVGAWNARNTIPSVAGATLEYEDLVGLELNNVAGYSSYGKLVDGRVLPDICSPGTAIVSSISTPYAELVLAEDSRYINYLSASQTYNNRANYWEAQQGTSMATPIVTGSIITWMEAHNDLTVSQALEAIKASAVIDADVTSYSPREQWGGGKFNALGGLKYVLNHFAGINDVIADAETKLVLTPNGSDWDIYMPGASRIDASLFSISGAKVASVSANGNEAMLSTADVAPGVYVLTVNGHESRRIVVK